MNISEIAAKLGIEIESVICSCGGKVYREKGSGKSTCIDCEAEKELEPIRAKLKARELVESIGVDEDFSF